MKWIVFCSRSRLRKIRLFSWTWKAVRRLGGLLRNTANVGQRVYTTFTSFYCKWTNTQQVISVGRCAAFISHMNESQTEIRLAWKHKLCHEDRSVVKSAAFPSITGCRSQLQKNKKGNVVVFQMKSQCDGSIWGFLPPLFFLLQQLIRRFSVDALTLGWLVSWDLTAERCTIDG